MPFPPKTPREKERAVLRDSPLCIDTACTDVQKTAGFVQTAGSCSKTRFFCERITGNRLI